MKERGEHNLKPVIAETNENKKHATKKTKKK